MGDNTTLGRSELERQRAERRRKIIRNQEERFKTVLGPNASLPKPQRSVFLDTSDEPVLPEEHLTREFLSNAHQRQRQPNGGTMYGNNFNRNSPTDTATKQYGKHRLYLGILGACLPFLGLNYVLLYFLLWEMAMVGLSGGIPFPPSPPNILLTVAMAMGLTEENALRIKLIIRISKWILTDLSFFFIAFLIPQLGLKLYSSVFQSMGT